MTTHADYVARTEAHLAVAEPAAATDPHIAALCGLATAILASRPALLRTSAASRDAERFLADTDGDLSPAAAAGRAVAAAIQAAQLDLDSIAVDDGGFPSPLIAA